jgi:hypothetical protein
MKNFQYLIKPFSENAEQQATIIYLKTRYPGVLFTTGLLGIKLPEWAMWLLIALGYRSGTPDIQVYVARHGFYGLFIEMKCRRMEYIENGQKKVRYAGKVTDEQLAFHEKLTANGYLVKVCYGADEAIRVIDGYLQK